MIRRGTIGLKPSIDHTRYEHVDGKLASVSVNQIVASKKAALRRHVWYRVLSRVERGVLDLTTRYVVRIRSAKLANVVSAILSKLESAVESMVDRLVRAVGFSLARKISDLAKRLGNRLAHGWAVDASFARFLAVMQFNAGRGG